MLAAGKQQTVAGIAFNDYGRHEAGYPHTYLTAAAAIGGTHAEVDVFIARLMKAHEELRSKWAGEKWAGGG